MSGWIPGIASRTGSALRFYLRGLVRRLGEENLLFLSAGISFNALLCLIPLLLLLTWLLGSVLQASGGAQLHKVDEILQTIFPPQPYARRIVSSLRSVIEDIVRYRKTFGVSGLLIFAWTAASLFSSLRTVLNRIYRTRPARMVVITALENVLLVAVLVLLFLVANAFTWTLSFLNSLLREVPLLENVNLTPYVKTVSFAASYVPALAMFYIVNRYVPGGGIPPRAALVAAVTTASLWWVAGKGFAWYLTASHAYSTLYGTYAFGFVFLVWIYYSAVVFVTGAIMGQLCRERTAPSGE